LLAMGIPSDQAQSVIRLYFGRYNTIAEVKDVAPQFIKVVQRQRPPLDDAASRL